MKVSRTTALALAALVVLAAVAVDALNVVDVRKQELATTRASAALSRKAGGQAQLKSYQVNRPELHRPDDDKKKKQNVRVFQPRIPRRARIGLPTCQGFPWCSQVPAPPPINDAPPEHTPLPFANKPGEALQNSDAHASEGEPNANQGGDE
eukprot:TRINITY_DN66170_c7_g2_i2.p1 TRINITY_DN66170_c7_g2~~TRINITY_DN66170_c7_g2_i2.p1  ORF type:complete len:162 (+),score=64.13 TRINITY_DN66170_c7_g2_i2:35-487(+)